MRHYSEWASRRRVALSYARDALRTELEGWGRTRAFSRVARGGEGE
jgi:hypothetical protein